jgi:hypothetical protein
MYDGMKRLALQSDNGLVKVGFGYHHRIDTLKIVWVKNHLLILSLPSSVAISSFTILVTDPRPYLDKINYEYFDS